jgi:hypothetical protein
MAPKIDPQNSTIARINSHRLPASKVATRIAARQPKTKIPRVAKPTFVEVLEGPVPRLRQNRVSF